MRRRRAAQGQAARTKPGSRRRPLPPGTAPGRPGSRRGAPRPPPAPVAPRGPAGSRRREQPRAGGAGSQRAELGHHGSRVCLLVLRVPSPVSALGRHSGSVAVPRWGFVVSLRWANPSVRGNSVFCCTVQVVFVWGGRFMFGWGFFSSAGFQAGVRRNTLANRFLLYAEVVYNRN